MPRPPAHPKAAGPAASWPTRAASAPQVTHLCRAPGSPCRDHGGRDRPCQAPRDSSRPETHRRPATPSGVGRKPATAQLLAARAGRGRTCPPAPHPPHSLLSPSAPSAGTQGLSDARALPRTQSQVLSLGDEFCLRTPRGGRWRSLARNAPPPTAAALAPPRSACSRPGAACAHACAGNVVGDGNSREQTRQKNKACRRAARLPGRGRGSRRKRREHGGGGSPGPWAPPGRPRSAVTGSRLRDSSGPNGKRRLAVRGGRH